MGHAFSIVSKHILPYPKSGRRSPVFFYEVIFLVIITLNFGDLYVSSYFLGLRRFFSFVCLIRAQIFDWLILSITFVFYVSLMFALIFII